MGSKKSENPFQSALKGKLQSLKNKDKESELRRMAAGQASSRALDNSPKSRQVASKKKSEPTDYSSGYADRVARNQAYAGVASIDDPKGKKGKARPKVVGGGRKSSDENARQRLAHLISEDLSFDINHSPNFSLLRQGAHRSQLESLHGEMRPGVSVDLHGMNAAEAQACITRTLKEAQKKGLQVVRIVTGKGLHSDGTPVLKDKAIETLSQGSVAPFVLAACDAPSALGGSGAMLVKLRRKK